MVRPNLHCHHHGVTQGREPEPDAGRTPAAGVVPAGQQRRDWFSRLILWSAAVVLGVSLVVIGAAYLPGWWADRVADVVAGNRTAGVLGGFACGLAFTALPLIVLRSAVRRGLAWTERLLRVVVAVLLAVPNLLTLGVVIRGGSPGALARAVLDARGPGFRGATLPGVLLGAVIVVGAWVLLAGRRRRLHELDDLRTELELRDTRDADTRGSRDSGSREGDSHVGPDDDGVGPHDDPDGVGPHDDGPARSPDLREPRDRPDA